MARHAPILLGPTRIDLWVGRFFARQARPSLETGARLVTCAADEKLLLAVVGLTWLGSRLSDAHSLERRRADHIALTIAVSAALPHVIKRLVRRERPDRVLVSHPRRGVPRSGKPFDSFPSGHSMHLAAGAAALSRWVSRPWPAAIWLLASAIASTRVILVAHWLTDVLAGGVIGLLLERTMNRIAVTRAAPDPLPTGTKAALRS